MAAARALPEAGYLALYATVGLEMPNGEPLHPGLRRPPPRRPRPGVADRRSTSGARPRATPSSFAARAGVLRDDLRLHRHAPRCSGAWDHALALAYQGRAPYGPARAGRRRSRTAAARALDRRAKVTVWRASLAAQALARRRSGRLLVAPRPALATHLESGVVATGTDWAAESEAALRWGA